MVFLYAMYSSCIGGYPERFRLMGSSQAFCPWVICNCISDISQFSISCLTCFCSFNKLYHNVDVSISSPFLVFNIPKYDQWKTYEEYEKVKLENELIWSRVWHTDNRLHGWRKKREEKIGEKRYLQWGTGQGKGADKGTILDRMPSCTKNFFLTEMSPAQQTCDELLVASLSTEDLFNFIIIRILRSNYLSEKQNRGTTQSEWQGTERGHPRKRKGTRYQQSDDWIQKTRVFNHTSGYSELKRFQRNSAVFTCITWLGWPPSTHSKRSCTQYTRYIYKIDWLIDTERGRGHVIKLYLPPTSKQPFRSEPFLPSTSQDYRERKECKIQEDTQQYCFRQLSTLEEYEVPDSQSNGCRNLDTSELKQSVKPKKQNIHAL